MIHATTMGEVTASSAVVHATHMPIHPRPSVPLACGDLPTVTDLNSDVIGNHQVGDTMVNPAKHPPTHPRLSLPLAHGARPDATHLNGDIKGCDECGGEGEDGETHSTGGGLNGREGGRVNQVAEWGDRWEGR